MLHCPELADADAPSNNKIYLIRFEICTLLGRFVLNIDRLLLHLMVLIYFFAPSDKKNTHWIERNSVVYRSGARSDTNAIVYPPADVPHLAFH